MKTSKGGLSGAAVAQLEGRHRSTGGNSLRAAVLGANDGMVSNLSLVMIDLSAVPTWNDIVTQIRLDPLDNRGEFAIDYIRIEKKGQ